MEATTESYVQNVTNIAVDNDYVDYVENAAVTLPPDLRFTGQSLTFVIAYCLCFLVAAVGNLTVFVTLSRGRYRKSRISLMICHLAAADLLVTFFMILHEVGWRITVQWLAGNLACKIFQFLKAFGLYLSSNILVCVSLDRYFAVLHPLRVNDARRRGKWMLAIAWIFSVICAVPQSFIFHVSRHPEYPDFKQCVTFGFFVSQVDETAYSIFCILAMYFVPLIVICWVYSRILCEINSKSRETITRSSSSSSSTTTTTTTVVNCSNGGRVRLRRSDMSSIERARSRTLRMTITIVTVFILCWTPYVTIMLWYIVDKHSAGLVDARLKDALLIMGVGNSCANPLVYGSYAVDFRKECSWCFSPYGASSSSRNNEDVKLKHLAGARKADKRPPGASALLVHRVQRAVRGLLVVQSGTDVCCSGSNLTSAVARCNSGGPNSNLNVPEGTSLCGMSRNKVENLRPSPLKSASSTAVLIDPLPTLQNIMERGSA